MPYKEKTDEDLKRYFSVGEMATELKVEPSAIRFWDDQFLMVINRDKKGHRQFTHEQADHLREIHRLLKVELYTIEGAKRQLRLAKRSKETITNLMKLGGYETDD